MDARTDLRHIPKVELHRHVDGSVRIATIWEIAQEHGLDLGAGSLEELQRKAVLRTPLGSLQSVLDCFATQQAALCSYQAISRVTEENIEDAWRDGVRLLELRFAPAFIARGKSLSNDDIISAVLEGTTKGMAAYPVEVGLIGILPRSYPEAENAAATKALIRWRGSGAPGAERICGFDLADSEDGFDPLTLVRFVDEAREAGLGVTVHTGENTTAAHVARAVELYRPARLGHGIRCIEDPELMKRLADMNILLEVSPTSNWITSAVPSLSAHPLPELFRAGVPVCLNSDDPNLFGIDLVNEYDVCAREWGFGNAEFSAMNRAALRHSFLPADVAARVMPLFNG
jgi:adenosine deaminase